MPIDAAEILSRFPGPLTLYPSCKKWLLVFSIGALFAAGGGGMINGGKGSGWFVLIFFALVAIVAAAAMLPGAGGLTLDRDGFEVTNLFRSYRARWQDTTGFTAVRIHSAHQKMVVYDDAKQSGRSLAQLNVAIAGRGAGLPDTYGLSADDLAQLMAQWRERALGRNVPR
jgi:hypothetical protein